MFKWRDRDGAVNQAAYQFIMCRENLKKHCAEMTQKEIDDYREIFNNPEWTPKPVVDEKTYVECASMVLGTGSKFQNYFCLDPENMKTRQWTRFLNDVKREVGRRDYNKRELALLERTLGK